MCVIVDADVAAAVFCRPPNPDFAPVVTWIETTGRLVIGGKLLEELTRVGVCRDYLLALTRAGRTRLIPNDRIEAEVLSIEDLCVSNDSHVVALARVSGARTLCSRDHALHQDFKNPLVISGPRGSVYQTPSHTRLLRHTSSCKPQL